MIQFDHVSFSYSDHKILNDINLRLEDGKFIGILGPNGGGKSTFLKLTLGLLKPTSGKILRTKEKVSYIAQTTSLSDSSFPATVEEIVSLGLSKELPFYQYQEKKRRTTEILKEFQLLHLRKRMVGELSGGQLQRVKIAKALIKDPDLIVLDEPDAGMDETSHENLVELINQLHERGKSILFVSHHPHDLEKADQILFVEEGKIVTYEEELKRGHHHVDL